MGGGGNGGRGEALEDMVRKILSCLTCIRWLPSALISAAKDNAMSAEHSSEVLEEDEEAASVDVSSLRIKTVNK